MRRIIHTGSQRIEILKWYECGPDDTCMEFRDPILAFSFLYTLTRDHFNMMALRDALADCVFCADAYRLTDHEICQQIAHQIARGYIRLVLREERERYAEAIAESLRSAKEADEVETAAAPTVQPAAEVPPAAPVETLEQPSAPAVEEEPLVPSSVAAAQAATFVLAAESGAPL